MHYRISESENVRPSEHFRYNNYTDSSAACRRVLAKSYNHDILYHVLGWRSGERLSFDTHGNLLT